MGKIKKILTIIYYVLLKPERVLETIEEINYVDKQWGGVKIYHARSIINGEYINIGKNSYINSGAAIWVHDSNKLHGENPGVFKGRLEIGDNVRIGGNVTIDCYQKIVIEDDCLVADNVYIFDINHGKNPLCPSYVENEGEINPVHIGKGCWIGARVCILPGADIGEKCIIGTNAVVTGKIPPYSIAVGIPARVIKTYNKDTGQWERSGDTQP